MKTLHVLTVGGTIDKVYFDQASDYEVGEPFIQRMLERFQVDFSWHITSLMRKDSLEMSDADRQLIADWVRQCSGSHILITHGTDTMALTARALQDIPDKRIVLTGAMLPAGFVETDALFNLGCAIGALNAASPGVYVAMNGRLFDPEHVAKDRQAGRFREV